jgi:hypothetical protein
VSIDISNEAEAITEWLAKRSRRLIYRPPMLSYTEGARSTVSGKWDSDPAAGFSRRLGLRAHELGLSGGDVSCGNWTTAISR